MSLGTSGTLYGYSSSALVDPEGKLAAFCSSTGGWLPLLCTMNCTVASEQIRSLFGMSIEEMNHRAAMASIGAEGIVVLPFFNGERVPNLPKGKAGILGGTATNFSKENIARAAMEAAIFAMLIGLGSFKRLGFAAYEIRLTGGGAKSAVWRDIAANVTDLPVRVPKEEEAAALGAALQALWCYECNQGSKPIEIEAIVDRHVNFEGGLTVEPERLKVRKYEEAYAQYEEYLAALTPLYR